MDYESYHIDGNGKGANPMNERCMYVTQDLGSRR